MCVEPQVGWECMPGLAPSKSPLFLHSASPGKSWLNLVTLASGAVDVPVHQPPDCHCPTTEHGHLPRCRPCPILAEAPCRPSRDGRWGQQGRQEQPRARRHRFLLFLPEVWQFCKQAFLRWLLAFGGFPER